MVLRSRRCDGARGSAFFVLFCMQVICILKIVLQQYLDMFLGESMIGGFRVFFLF